MNGGEWIALAGLSFTVIVAIAGGCFKLGQHSQRITALEERTKDLPAVAVLATTIGALKEQVSKLDQSITKRIDDLDHDFRNLLTGKLRPARRDPEN
jgi:hypothetical protein